MKYLVRACGTKHPHKSHVAIFDTAFEALEVYDERHLLARKHETVLPLLYVEVDVPKLRNTTTNTSA